MTGSRAAPSAGRSRLPREEGETGSRAIAGPRPLLVFAAAAAGAIVFASAAQAGTAPACVAQVNKAALQAMNRTNPLGQMQVFGSPVAFGKNLLRATVRVFGARTEIYAVDLTIDDACNVLSASTRLETNEWPSR